MANVHTHDGPSDGGAAQRKVIWKTFWILLILTALEFLIAFTVPHGTMKVTVFILMTFVKAYYIVGDFMHLKHEAKGLVWSIVLPIVFIIWLLVALAIEGESIFNAVWL